MPIFLYTCFSIAFVCVFQARFQYNEKHKNLMEYALFIDVLLSRFMKKGIFCFYQHLRLLS